jgi:hypothetical protein
MELQREAPSADTLFSVASITNRQVADQQADTNPAMPL